MCMLMMPVSLKLTFDYIQSGQDFKWILGVFALGQLSLILRTHLDGKRILLSA